MRIFDRISSGEAVKQQPGLVANGQMQSAWRKVAHTATRLVADDAAQYAAQSDQIWHVADGDFGAMRPSFDVMWIEWQTPTFVVLDGEWITKPAQQVACVVQQKGPTTLSLTSLLTYRGAAIHVLPLYVEIENFADVAEIDARGSLVYDDDALQGLGGEDEKLSGINAWMTPAYLTLGWLNCRNVGTENVTPNTRIAAKRERRGQPRGLDYKRIVLDEGTHRALSANRRAERHGQRLHIVRGHIKHYTPERPLFGKYTGNYWWHQQMRGNADLGRINHEYHVANRGPR